MVESNKKLEMVRMQRRWSVAVASEKAQVSINTFNRWERGLQVPQLSSLDQLCNAFGLTPEELGFAAAVAPKQVTSSVEPEKSPSDTSFSPQRAVLTFTASPFEDHLLTHSAHHTLYLEQAKRSIEDMVQVDNEKDKGEEHRGISRRRAIAALVSTPAAMLSFSEGAKSALLQPEEVLALCTIGIPLCWELYFEGGLAEVECVLPGYLTQLTTLMQSSPVYQQKTAVLLSQGYQLASLLTLQHQNFGSAHTYAKEAFQIGEQIGDANLQTASLIRQAQVYLYLKRPLQRLLTYERAQQCSERSSPLLRGRVYIGLTEAHSCVGNTDEAQRFLLLAHETFPADCKSDPNYRYTHFDSWSLAGLEAKMYLHLKQPKQAWELFSRMEKSLPETLVPSRVELTVRKAEASLILGEKDLACTQVRSAVQSARAVGNHLRCDEAYTIYEGIRTKWSRESKVRELAKLFL